MKAILFTGSASKLAFKSGKNVQKRKKSAGLMSLKQGISVIFGANIGTTMTAQLMAFKISDYRRIEQLRNDCGTAELRITGRSGWC